MKTRIYPDMVSPNLLTDVIRSGSKLHFTYGDGTSEEIDVLTIGQAVLATATATANSQIATATADFVGVNPSPVSNGDVKTSGLSAFVYNDTWIQVSA
jgi:hypothetical protein